MFLLGLTAYLCSMWHEEHKEAVASSWLPFVHLHWSSVLQQALPNGLPGGPLKPSLTYGTTSVFSHYYLDKILD